MVSDISRHRNVCRCYKENTLNFLQVKENQNNLFHYHKKKRKKACSPPRYPRRSTTPSPASSTSSTTSTTASTPSSSCRFSPALCFALVNVLLHKLLQIRVFAGEQKDVLCCDGLAASVVGKGLEVDGNIL